MKSLFDGLLTGLFLQLALGPVFFYILGITIDSSYTNGLYAIAAVTLADYFFIILSLIGIGQWLKKDETKFYFGSISSMVLILFGVLILYKGFMDVRQLDTALTVQWSPINSFTSCFFLTISSPLTIVFWGSVFSAKAVEKNYYDTQLVRFGVGAGASTFIFLSATMWILGSLKTGIPPKAVQMLNCAVGGILIYYGALRSFKLFQERSDPKIKL